MATEKVTAKSSKQEIFDAYQNALAQLKAKESTQLRPEKIKEHKRREEVVEKTKALSTDGVQKSIETLRNRTHSALAEIEQEITSKLGELETVKEGIQFHQQELKEIFGIEKEAGALAALVEAQNEERQNFNLEMEDRRVQFEEDMRNQRKAWENEKAEYMRVQALKAEQDRVTRDRDIETYKYNFQRDQQSKMDKLADELSQKTKAFENDMELRNKKYNEQLEALAKREAQQAELEKKIISLENEKVQLLASTESKVNAAVEQAKKSAQTGYAIEVNALKKSHEAQVMVLDARVADLTSRYEDARQQNSILTTKLEAAYNKVQSVAEKALEAQGGREALAQVQRAVETAGTTKR